MKKTYRILAVMLMVLLGTTVAMSFMGSVKAANDYVELQAEKSGDTVTVKLVALQSISNFGGVEFDLSYDKDVFTFTGKEDTLNGTYNTEEDFYSCGGLVDLVEGDTIVTLTFSVGEAYEKGQAYDFTMQFSEAFEGTGDMADYDWKNDQLTATIQEEEPTTTPEETTPEETTPEETTPEETTPEETTPEETTPVETTPEETTPEETTPEETTAEETTPEATTPEETTPEETTPEATTPEETTPEETTPEETTPEETTPEETTPEETTPVETTPEETTPEETTEEPTTAAPTTAAPTTAAPTKPVETKPSGETPDTGDHPSMGIWLAMLAVAAGGMFTIAAVGKKRTEEE